MYACATAGDGGVRLWRAGLPGPLTGGTRGVIQGFSRASQRRLTDRLMFVPWNDYTDGDRHRIDAKLCLVTLTYPAEYPRCSEIHKRHLDNFRRALDRVRGGEYAAIWRLEYQKRGAPHYHILMLFKNTINITRFTTWARATWFRIVESGDRRHLLHGADVRAVYKPKTGSGGLMRYLVKYLGKVCETEDLPGRIWGEWGSMPEVVRMAVVFETRQGLVEFIRRVRRWGKKSQYLSRLQNITGLRLFGDGASVLGQLVRGIESVTAYET